MGELVSRSFRCYGWLCAQKPWEVMFLIITATIAMVTVGDWGTQPPSEGHYCDAQQEQCSSSSNSAAERGYDGVDVMVMTALRCAAMLYTYHQLRLLHRQGSKYILGIACLFVVFSTLVFCCLVVTLLGSPVADLKDAVFFFLLVLDLSKVSRLSVLALSARSMMEATDSIGEGLALLGPSLSLDTCVEALLVGAGSLSGVRRLEQICQFAVLSILLNYLMLMTFFPACLSLVLQMSSRALNSSNSISNSGHSTSTGSSISSSITTPNINNSSSNGSSSSTGCSATVVHQCKPVWHLGYSVHCAAAIMGDASTHNPVQQRVKVIMSAGLVLVHGIRRYSLPFPASVDPPLMHSGNTSSSHEDYAANIALRWLSVGLEQMVVVVLVVALLVKYVMFEGRRELEQQLLSQKQQEQELQQQKLMQQELTQQQQKQKQQLKRLQLKLMQQQEQQEQDLCKTETAKQEDQDYTTSAAAAAADVRASTVSRATSALTVVEAAVNDKVASKETAATEPVPSLRSTQDCLALLNTKDGAAELLDEEVVQLVKEKLLPGYKLESALQDYVRGVRVRRQVMAQYSVHPTAMDNLPYQHYDYSKVVGACCESVVGYIPVPVGVAGPLTVNGSKFLLPLATTEGCLVASTNRGCRALQLSEEGGVKSYVLQNGMTRAPAVKLPSIQRATELYHWLHDADNIALIKIAFDGTSNYARMADVSPTLNGRKLHLRFLASTGDAMGMNMVSKGVEASLKVIKEFFPDLEVVSISGNLCTDKKPSAVNWVKGRGKYVVCGAVLPGDVVKTVLKTTVSALVNCHISKNLEGSALAGSIGGNNAHAANIVAAFFIATGQDAAQVVGSSNCITQLEACGKDGEDLFASVTMPSLEVGTVGGGTALAPQAACLSLLGVKGANHGCPGDNAVQLARVVAGAVLAGELSLMAALTAGHLVNSHMKHNRAKATAATSSDAAQHDHGHRAAPKDRDASKITQNITLTSQTISEASQNINATIQNISENSQNTHKNSQNTNETSQNTHKNSQNTNETTQNTNETSRNTNETSRNTNETSQNTNETSQNTNETSQNTNETSQNTNETSQNTNETSQNTNETSQNTNETSQNTNETSQNTNETSQNIVKCR